MFNLRTPISHVRSTNNEKSSLVERRRRPNFSLSLAIPLYSSRAARAQANSELSPSFCPSLSPTITTASSISFSGPCTPIDGTKPDWPRHIKGMIEPFNHASGVDASSDDFTHSHFRCLSGGDPLMAHSALQPAFPVPATRVSDPQAGLVGLASKHSVDAEHAASGSATSFRRRSGRSHNRDLAISNPTQTRTRSSTASASRDVTPSHVVSSSYRQLSEKEIKNLNLDPDRRHYKCLVDGCERVFGRKSNVENHIRTHLDDKPFVCSLGTW